MTTRVDGAFAIGICGGSGSGKTTVANALFGALSGHRPALLRQDAYYRDLSHLHADERGAADFDHPDAIDWELMAENLLSLKSGRGIDAPVYDFTLHVRAGTESVRPSKVIIIEGHLILAVAAVRELLDLRVFIDAPHGEMLQRRIRRDMRERGRSYLSIVRQYEKTVLPALRGYVEPSRKWADAVVADERAYAELLEILCGQGFTASSPGNGE